MDRPAGERTSFLNEACADPEIRREVEALLARASSGDSLLRHSPWVTPASLGPYRIGEKIGGGGMGEVYRAHDSRLGRDVALKILPAEMTGDPGRRARFLREAQSAARLNSPNIVTIHDVGESEGCVYIAMEYVTGKTLDDLIPRSGMPWTDVVKYAIPVARALEKAHAAGIVHRDLKPGIIMVTDEGTVKVLDFGLAKLLEAPVAAGQQTQSGMVIGTPAYMSPEQAEGKTVDTRSDIFSFGAVIYQMVTGKRAFTGDSTMATMAAVLHTEPGPFPPGVPHDLERIISRCLRKDPERRFQHIDDARVELAELEKEPLHPAGRRKRTRTWMWFSAGAAALIAANVGLWFMKFSSPPLPPENLVSVTAYAGSEMYPSFSPDGKQLAFYWDGEKRAHPGIYRKLLGETIAFPLSSGPDSYPVWSPDGTRIAFARGNPQHGIYTVSALGGTERELFDIETVGQISWSPDGRWLAASSGGKIALLPLAGGKPRRVSDPKALAIDRAPAFARDGRRLAYARCTGAFSCGLWITDLNTAQSRQVTHEALAIHEVTWSRDGRSLIYSSSSYLWQIGIGGAAEPQRLDLAGAGAFAPSVSPTENRLLFQRSPGASEIWRYRVNGGMEPLIVSSSADSNPQYSPDGTRIAFQSDRSGEGAQIWVAQSDGSNPVQLTRGIGRTQETPHWSPDGKWIYFKSNCGATSELWRVPLTVGTVVDGNAEQVTTDGSATLFYTKSDFGPLFTRPLPGGEEHQVLPYVSGNAFGVVADGIYYIGRPGEEGDYPLEFFQFAGRTSRLLTTIEGQVNRGLSVSPDRKWILFSRNASFGSNLMMIENFRQ